MSKKAKSEKRRKTVTFPEVDICRLFSTSVDWCWIWILENSKISRHLVVTCDRWCRHEAQFDIEMLIDKGSVFHVVAAHKSLFNHFSLFHRFWFPVPSFKTGNQKRWKSEKWFYRFMDQKAEFGRFSVAFWSTFFVNGRCKCDLTRFCSSMIPHNTVNSKRLGDQNTVFHEFPLNK